MQWTRTLAAIVLVAFSTLASAELKVGVVNLRQALFTSEQAESFSKKVQQELAPQREEVEQAQKEAQELKKRLEKDGAMMSESERQKLARQFQAKVQEFNLVKRQFEQEVSSRQQEFLKQSRPQVDKALQEILEANELDLILPREAVVYAKPSLDLTEQLINKLNDSKAQ